MSATFLAGVLSAWGLAHLGLASFFILAYALGRRETEYLLFGLLCGAFSILTGGVTQDLLATEIERRVLADQITHTGGVLAAAINVHFAACFAFPQRNRRLLAALYGVAALLLGAVWSGALWVSGSYRLVDTRAFGFQGYHAIGNVTGVGILFYAIVAAETALAVAFLVWAVRRGRREALSSLVGAAAGVLAVANDCALALGWIQHTITLVPHVFLVYAFGASGTLLWRYRAATGELEQTTHRLQQRTEELRHSYAELAQVQNELSTKRQLAAVGELAAAIAHEVRNPLAIIVTALAGLRRPALDDTDRTTLLGIVEEETRRLDRLVTDLLRFARPVKVKRAPVSLLELANRCRMNAADEYEVRVECSEDPDIKTVYLDPNLFRLVFDNLVANAFQAMRDGGVVDIVIDRTELRGEPAARVVIQDKGHGMEPHVRQRALDPFFTTRPSGTGLGLPIVQRIIEAHGGELLLDSEENEGTRITIVVPVGAPDVTEAPIRTERVA